MTASNATARPDPGRAPLPPGDPIAWGILVAGTSLEGLAWPGWGTDGWDAPHRQGVRSFDSGGPV